MTWLSRLLPQSPSLQRVANHNNRTRQAQRRRRQATLESLEDRTLLSNVTLSYTASPAGAVTLNILGDAGKDNFSVTENANGTVTVAGTGGTTISSLPSVTTLKAITNINITLPGTNKVTDNVSITGHGTVQNITVVVPGNIVAPANVTSTTTGVAGTDLNLTVTNLHNSGEFNVFDAPTTSASNAINPLPSFQPAFAPDANYTQAGYSQVGGGYSFPTDNSSPTPNPINQLGGVLNLSMSSSSFASSIIEQDGYCQATVTFVALDSHGAPIPGTGDIIPGNVFVAEGIYSGSLAYWKNGISHAATPGDTVTSYYDDFGPTWIGQAYGPTTFVPCCTPQWTGTNDLITVDDSIANPTTHLGGIYSLFAIQLGTGSNQQILVGTHSEVEVALQGFGIIAAQPCAWGYDTIHIESITVYYRTPVNTKLIGPPSIVTYQGDGFQETAIVDSSTVYGDIIVIQGNGAGDYVHIADDAIGFTVLFGPYTVDPFGLLVVVQGNGYADSVVVDSNGSEPGINPTNIFNNVVIIQGDGTDGSFSCCAESLGDTVDFEESNVTSNLFIIQGVPFREKDVAAATAMTQANYADNSLLPRAQSLQGDGTENGFNTVSIGADPTPSGAVESNAVSVGNWTLILQFGSDNTDYFGGASAVGSGLIDFETDYLDVYTGYSGGNVYAQNTVVDSGSFFAYLGVNYVISGGPGGGNTLWDNGDNSTGGLPFLTFDTNSYVCVGC